MRGCRLAFHRDAVDRAASKDSLAHFTVLPLACQDFYAADEQRFVSLETQAAQWNAGRTEIDGEARLTRALDALTQPGCGDFQRRGLGFLLKQLHSCDRNRLRARVVKEDNEVRPCTIRNLKLKLCRAAGLTEDRVRLKQRACRARRSATQ